MKKVIIAIAGCLLLVGCAKTSLPEDLSGKMDVSKPVEYVVVEKKDRDKAIYVLMGLDPEKYKTIEIDDSLESKIEENTKDGDKIKLDEKKDLPEEEKSSEETEAISISPQETTLNQGEGSDQASEENGNTTTDEVSSDLVPEE